MIPVNSTVRLKCNIWEPATGDSPGGLLAECGDMLVVRGESPFWDMVVSHPNRKDHPGFGVVEPEVEVIELADEEEK